MSGYDDVNGILSRDGRTQRRGGHTNGEDSDRAGNPERGFGKLANQTFYITEDNVDKIERHLSKTLFLGDNGLITPENAKMIERLRMALVEGRPIAEADASFYFHELYEADLMDNSGLDYDTAHRMALDHYGVAAFTIYHPDVIREFSEYFGNVWLEFWEIGGQ